MKVVLFGASGQLGRHLKNQLELDGHEVVAFDHRSADFSRPLDLVANLERSSPKLVMNAAAYTDVPKAETDQDLALLVNATAPAAIAQWCAERQIPFISYSTDFVFDGKSASPYSENDQPRPLNVYGKTKFEGEKLIAGAGGCWMIFRTSWVYSEFGKNFFLTMVKLGSEREEIKVVNDQFGAPTYAYDIVQTTGQLIKEQKFIPGIYNMTNSGSTSWHGFASHLFKLAPTYLHIKVQRVTPISAADFNSPVLRPANSRLDCSKLKKILGLELRSWEKALEHCMERFLESQRT